ncbi:MAG: hypothetical protein JST01_03895 [Cyanobacteria bacterium SZAS TMP-1]|nr:hypothetical protein [Cyanobacteria bacterium SZAS TMP-1]
MHKSHPGLPDGVRFGSSAAEDPSPQAVKPALPPLSLPLLKLVAAHDLARQITHGLVKAAEFPPPLGDGNFACQV